MSVTEPLITVEQGVLRGVRETTEYYSFFGVPYAQPPVGKLRFKAPKPALPWQGIHNATKEGSHCLSRDFFFNYLAGSEDCLNLNIYTKHLPTAKKDLMPVMVWFHGGAFMHGSAKKALYGPDHLIQHDVILVTVNYRLWALGFLQLEDQSLGVLGNAALKDQVMALKWVQNNIEKFGGDAKNVTIFGESSGAACVHCHLVSPMSKGLFHKAILQSGSANCVWSEGQPNAGYELAKHLGKTAQNDAELLDILQAASKEELHAAYLKIPDLWKTSFHRFFAPTIEKHDNIDELFLSDYPLELIKSGRYHRVPLIIGASSGEGLVMRAVEQVLGLKLTPISDDDFVPHTYRLEMGAQKTIDIGAKIRAFYFGEQEPAYSPKQLLYKYLTDAYFVRPVLDVAESIMQTSDANVYLYRFNVISSLNVFAKLVGARGKGTCHSDVLNYLFKCDLAPKFAAHSLEDRSVQRMTKWWTNFAKYSDPNGASKVALLSVTWPTSDAESMTYIEIDNDVKVKTHYEGEMFQFWKTIDRMV